MSAVPSLGLWSSSEHREGMRGRKRASLCTPLKSPRLTRIEGLRQQEESASPMLR